MLFVETHWLYLNNFVERFIMSLIKDGTGSGYLAKVDSSNNLQVVATSTQIDAAMALEGNFYAIRTGYLDITTAGGRIMWVYLSETVKNLVLARIVVGWNGGNTNHNRALEVGFYAGEGAPTTNITALAARNANTGSPNTVSLTALGWNGVGDGMDGYAAGLSVSDIIIGQGTTTLDLHGTMIVVPGVTVSIGARGEEAGKLSCTAWFYLVDPTE